MNSDEERKLFERFGWQYDYIKREWHSPPKNMAVAIISTDELVQFTQDFMGDLELKSIIAKYGIERGE